MDKLRAWLQDQKNLPVVAAAAGIVVVIVILVLMKQAGVIGGGGPQMAETFPPAEGPSVGLEGGPDAGMETPASVEGPSPTMMPGQPPPMPAAGLPEPSLGTAQSAPAKPSGGAGQVTAKLPPMLPYRKDPFVSFSGPPTKKDALMAMLPSVSRIRIAPAQVRWDEKREEQFPEAPPPQPFRRMAGVLWNGRVSAILETEGQVRIVKPGDDISTGRSTVRVERIEPDAIILKTLDTKEPMTIRVNMAGSIAGRSEAARPGVTDGGLREPMPVPPPPPVY